jgi:hypothetical protein
MEALGPPAREIAMARVRLEEAGLDLLVVAPQDPQDFRLTCATLIIDFPKVRIRHRSPSGWRQPKPDPNPATPAPGEAHISTKPTTAPVDGEGKEEVIAQMREGPDDSLKFIKGHMLQNFTAGDEIKLGRRDEITDFVHRRDDVRLQSWVDVECLDAKSHGSKERGDNAVADTYFDHARACQSPYVVDLVDKRPQLRICEVLL